MRFVTSLILAVALGAVTYMGFACAMQRRVLYPRPPASKNAPALPTDARIVFLGPDRDVEAFYWPPPDSGVPTSEPAPALVFTHGNGELIDHWIALFREPRGWGMGILLVEYPGYGRSAGSPSERSIREVIVSGYDYLAARPEIDDRRVVAYGRSLGGGAACALSNERDVAALILESTFTSVRDIAADFFVPGLLVLDPFENLAAVSRFEGPILVIHGERDRVIPVAHGRALANAARTTPVLLSCGHNDCPRPWPEIREFLLEAQLLGPTVQPHARAVDESDAEPN